MKNGEFSQLMVNSLILGVKKNQMELTWSDFGSGSGRQMPLSVSLSAQTSFWNHKQNVSNLVARVGFIPEGIYFFCDG